MTGKGAPGELIPLQTCTGELIPLQKSKPVQHNRVPARQENRTLGAHLGVARLMLWGGCLTTSTSASAFVSSV
eukprot:1158605-Pelagomonas_calceolata.AAC.10